MQRAPVAVECGRPDGDCVERGAGEEEDGACELIPRFV